MEKRKKRARSSNWNHAHTMALAELKKEASLNKEDGPLVWERIAQTLSSRFPGQIRTGDQCRRRWDTLVKVYNHIEDYCVQTGAQDHRELDEGELASMKLDTAYQQDWYDILEQVCSQRKRKERCDRDLMLAKRIKESRTGSHSVELPERPPNRDTLCSVSAIKSVTYHEQSTPESTTTYAQVSSSPSLEVDRKLGSDQEVPRLENGNDGLVLEVTGQHGQVSHEDFQEPQTLESAKLLPHTLPAENGSQLEEPRLDDVMASFDAMLLKRWMEQRRDRIRIDGPLLVDLESVGLGPQPKEPLLDHVRDDSFEVIVLSVLQCCHACGRIERTEDMDMESKQATRLQEKARKTAPLSRKESVSAMLNAASSTSATSATRGDEPLQKDTQRISKQAASDKKEEEAMPRKAERPQLGGKSSSKCVPVGQLCAKLSRKLFPAFRGQGSH